MDSGSVSYTLFLYREELQRSQCRYKTLNRTKLSLTDKLITISVRNLKQCSMDDLRAINRELVFKKKLQNQMKRIKKLEKLGMKNPNPNKASKSSKE
ncbi:uncharacterized protein LOC119607834 [Lucilia sericata]|uniref:uncharacterized protein LOC119607834 n=1 Tax=Lucilia sericata TaxID=13632 RepID=UPI0018A8508A|nr:uncharacterized protein LOC119607834 [Lucilia sericata]